MAFIRLCSRGELCVTTPMPQEDAAFYQYNDDKFDYTCRECRKADYQKVKHKKQAYQRLLKYGIDEEQFARMIIAQDGLCAVCRKPEKVRTPSGELQALQVDHDHSCCSGKKSCGECVRGLLCTRCNRALGLLGEDSEAMRNMIEYVEEGGFY